jgi:hypothetical protein
VGSIRLGRVDEYDAEGQLVRSQEVQRGAMGLERMPGGNILVAYPFMVGEYRPDKSVCWEVSLPHIAEDVRRLDGGNILAALDVPGRVVEVDRQGKVVWEIKDLCYPYSAQRVENGNTLICEKRGNRIVEVDGGGKVVWSYPIRFPTKAQRLPDGHTVIATPSKVFEIDAGSKVLWEQKVSVAFHMSAY